MVYRSVNAYTNQPIAIKKFKNSLNEGLPTSFIRELSVLKQLQGQHTVRLLDIDTTHQDPELIMEWIDTSMANLLARNDSPPELRRELVRQILTGVV